MAEKGGGAVNPAGSLRQACRGTADCGENRVPAGRIDSVSSRALVRRMGAGALQAMRLLLVLMMCAGMGRATNVSVRVADPQESAIPSAMVALISAGGERSVLTTDSAGNCRFGAVAAGEYFVEAAAEGFDASGPQTIKVTSGDVELTVRLGIAQVHSALVVTASGTPETTDEVAKALTVVDGSAIDQRMDRSVGEALADVPGLRVTQLGGPGSMTYFQVRGLRSTDTAVLIDGMRLRDAAGTQADASDVLQDLLIVDTSRIEVLRGAGSSLYGTDATGGVVNVVTDEGGGRTRGSVAVDGGSLGSVRGTARVAGSFAKDRLQYSAGVTHWNVMSGVEGDSPARNTSGQGQATWRLSHIAWLSARIYAGDSFSTVRITPEAVGDLPAAGIVNAVASGPAATFVPAAFDSDSTRVGHVFTGALKFTVRPSDRFGFTAQYQDVSTVRNYGDGPAGPGPYQPGGTDISDYTGRIQTGGARVDFAVGRYQRVDAGYEYENEDFRNKLLPPPPVAAFYSDISQRSHAIYGQDQWRLAGGRLRIAAAYRGQFFRLDAPHFDPASGAPFAGRTFAAPPAAQTGDVSAAYSLRKSGTKLRAHAGRGYRAPSLFERFGSYFDGNLYTLYGDPGLRPDRSSSIDGGIDQTLWNSRVQLSATYFFTRLNEVIIFDTSGAITPLTDPLGRYGGYRNTGGGLARGVEFSATAAATRSLQVTAGYTYTDARQETPVVSGVWQMFEAPRQQYSAFATERFSARWTAVLGYVGTSAYLVSVSGLAMRFGGPSRAQANLSYRLPLSDYRAMRFYTRADNLFNQVYYADGFRTPGVTFTAGTQFEF
jgi:vitamin B12 transporter